MENAKVIEFPKEKSTRKRLQLKTQEQKSALILSIASVLFVTVMLNQWVTKNSDTAFLVDGTRNVASASPASSIRELKFEHSLAKTFADDKVHLGNANLAEVPTVRDELIFGFLEGKYGMKLSQGRIESLEFIDAQAGDQPLEISDKAEFLEKYAEAFGVAFSEVSATASAEGEQVYSLIDSNKQIVGQAQFKTDDQGRVASIHFKL